VQRVGAYEVLYELKSGGMGSVLLGRRRGPGGFEKLVAIKTIRAELAAAQQVRAMFLDEAALLARLAHPAVAAVHDFGEEGKNLYLVMEYVAGVSLHAVAELAPPPHIVARLLAEACRGLHAAHELRDVHGAALGVVHRDISPDNLLLGFDGHVKVIDFGIALIKNRQAPVTELGMLKGKPPYMSPEQIKNEPVDRRSDVFALGAVLWELLVGEPLFSGDSIYAIARAVEHQEIERPSARVAELPPGLDSIVLEALRRDPAERTPTAAAMAARLDEVVAAAGGETLEEWTHRTLAQERESHRRWLAQVLSGGSAAPRMGRATGAVTALAALPGGPVGPAAVAAEAVDLVVGEGVRGDGETAPGREARRVAEAGAGAQDREAGSRRATHPGDPDQLDEESAVAPSRPRFAVLLVAAVLLAGFASWLVLRREPAAPAGRGSLADAGAPISTAPTSRDAAILAEAPRRDATPPSDAGAPADAAVSPRDGRDGREASPRRRDARPRTLPADAGQEPEAPVRPPPDTAPAVQGKGKIDVLADPYALVAIDGEAVGPTPIFGRPVSAGRHTVTLTDPVSGEVLLRKIVEVPVNGKVRVAP
jgi:eukaryotic-like serine/threonine-protein kinase